MGIFKRPLRDSQGKNIRDDEGNLKRDPNYSIGFAWPPGSGKRHSVYTGTPDADEARAIERKTRRECEQGRADAVFNGLRRRHADKLQMIFDAYSAAGFPDRYNQPIAEKAARTARAHIKTLGEWWRNKAITQIRNADQSDYGAHRKSTVTRGSGDRTVDLELQTLWNMFGWAVRVGKIEKCPLTIRLKFHRPSFVRHAREFMPSTAIELFAIIEWLRENVSESRAYQVQLMALTGLREGETLLMLAYPSPPAPGEAPCSGWISPTHLHIRRLKRGCNPRISLTDPQRPEIGPLLWKIKNWIARNPGRRSFLFPGLQVCTASKDIQLACKALGLPERHAHGMRAYYISARLAQGIEPATIAREVGQRSGDQLIRDVYGIDPDEFQADDWRAFAGQLTWTPPPVPPNENTTPTPTAANDGRLHDRPRETLHCAQG